MNKWHTLSTERCIHCSTVGLVNSMDNIPACNWYREWMKEKE